MMPRRVAAGCSRRALPITAFLVVVLACWVPASARAVRGADRQYDELWRTSTVAGFHTWSLAGTAIQGVGSKAGIVLERRPHAIQTCNSADIDGGRAQPDPATGLCFGNDPKPARDRYYNGSVFRFGTLVSPVHRLLHPVDQLIASWDAATPRGTWMEVHVRLLEHSGWTRLFRLPIWSSDSTTIRRHSVDHQNGAEGRVDTDTIVLPSDRPATAYQVEVTLFAATAATSPSLHLISVTASHDSSIWPAIAPDRAAWGEDLAVPQRSQMAARFRRLGYGGGGEAWCSPTSTSMVLAYWARVLGQPKLDRTVPEVASGVYDATYDGTGNWPFNTAYAAGLGFTAYVARMNSMSGLERWIQAGVPIVISVAFGRGDLPGEPIGVSDGHLMVVRGFTGNGDVVTNDPAAAADSGVRIIFNRAALERVWRKGSHGTAYVIYPAGWTSTHTVRK